MNKYVFLQKNYVFAGKNCVLPGVVSVRKFKLRVGGPHGCRARKKERG